MFCKLHENVQGIWVVCWTLIFASVKKYRVRTTHQSDYMAGKARKVKILKNEAQSQVRIFWQKSQNLMFWAETFFQVPLKKIL